MNLTQAGWSQRGTHIPPGTRLPLDGDSINALIRQAHAPVRVDSYDLPRAEVAGRVVAAGKRRVARLVDPAEPSPS